MLQVQQACAAWPTATRWQLHGLQLLQLREGKGGLQEGEDGRTVICAQPGMNVIGLHKDRAHELVV